jgi:transcriptional regulator of acetoin/glycerol metabolism
MIRYSSGTRHNTYILEKDEQNTISRKNLLYHEKKLIKSALDECAWNISKAARHLGISRNTLRYRIKKHNITSAAKKS